MWNLLKIYRNEFLFPQTHIHKPFIFNEKYEEASFLARLKEKINDREFANKNDYMRIGGLQ